MIPAFITLLFAHFAADYPLQPYWLVLAKRRLWGLSLHILIHTVTMFAVFGRAALQAWPVLLAVAAAHFCIDFVKVRLSLARPEWIIVPYFIDQGLHYLTLWIAAGSIARLNGMGPVFLGMPASAYALGYLLVTYVWFISERILVHAQPELVKETVDLRWARMLGRAALFSLLLVGYGNGNQAALSAGFLCPAIFSRKKYHCWTLLVDIAISILAFVLVRWVLMNVYSG